MVQPYKHEPFTNFTIDENRQGYLTGLNTVESYLGQDYPLVIGGEKITTEDKIASYNPANKQELIGRVSKANRDLAQQAMEAAV
ncbi:L-glutamate gamma-semialdehyde dehydrogenase, partial [Pseudoneobacillus sp. C159]